MKMMRVVVGIRCWELGAVGNKITSDYVGKLKREYFKRIMMQERKE